MSQENTFILRTNPNGLRECGVPMSMATAVRHAKVGRFAPLTYLSPHKSGFWRNSVLAWLEGTKQAA